VDCFVRFAPLRKRFAFVAGNGRELATARGRIDTRQPSTNGPERLSSWFVPPRISPAISAEPAALLPDRFLQWFASRGWSPREHQLELLAKASCDRSALLIAPTGAGKTLAGFLPTLVELSAPSSAMRASPLPPRSGGEGSGVGGASAYSNAEFAALPPTPDLESELRSPRTPPRASRAGGGERRG